MLKSLSKLTRRVAFGAALLAGVAGFAGTANAAAGDAQALTTAGSSVALQAPFTTQFVAGYGQQVRLNVTLDAGTAGEVDFMALYAFLYQNGTYVAAVRSDVAASGANAKTQIVTLPANNSPFAYNQVAFAYLNVGADGGITANATPDTLNGVAMTTRVLRIRPDQITGRTGGAGVGLSAVAVAAYTATSAGTGAAQGNVTAGQLASIGGSLNSNLISVTNYAGPVLTNAGTVSLAAAASTDVKLTFDTALSAIGDNNTVAVAGLQVDVNDNTGRVTAAQTSAAVTAGDFVVRFDDTNAFDNTLVSVDINPIALGSCLANFIRDEAGNCAANSQAFAIAAFAQPRFATAGTAKFTLTGGTAVSSATEIANLYTTAGTTATTGDGLRFTFTARMSENFNGVGINNVDDYTFTPTAVETLANATNVNTSGANTNTFTVSVDVNNNDRVRVNATTGALQYSSDAGVTWTDVTFNLAVGATALTTAENVALTTAPTAVTAFSAIAPAAPTVATRDANVDGILDGVAVTFATDVTNVNATGFSIFDRDVPATNVSAITVAAGSSANIVNVNGTQATIVGYLTGAETSASVLNTGVTNATPIPYDFSLTNATVTYARVYNSTTGNLLAVPNFAAAGTISDGAGPVLLSVSRVLGEANDPEGTLTLRFSETMLGGAVPSTVSSTPGGTLFGQILSLVDDGGAATNGTLATFTGSAINNDSLVFSDVDNDVISSLTAVGVSSGNASVAAGSAIRDANANRAGVQSVVPGTATVVTNVAPTADRAVAVVDANQNITNVLVFLTKNVTLTGTNLQNQFAIEINGTANALAPVTATVTGNIINLALSGGGVPLAQVQLVGNDRLSYTNGAPTVQLADVNSNVLATFGPLAIDLPANSDNLFTMDIRGNVKTTGTTNVPQGTIVRADLMRFVMNRVVDRGTVKIPGLDGNNGSNDIALVNADFDAINTAVNNANVLNETGFTAWVTVQGDTNGRKTATIGTARPAAGAAATVHYQVSVNRTTGAITSTGNAVTGQLVFRNGPITYTAVDSARFAVVNGTDGNFRVNVGTNNAAADAFVILSVRQNGSSTSSWVPVTFADASLAGYLPFNQDVRTTTTTGQSDSPFIDFENVGGANGSVVANFVLSNVRSIDLADSTNYQLVGLPGQIARNSTALNDFRAFRFFATINTATGAPHALWSFGGDNTEAFTLVGNAVKSSFSLGNVNVENIRNSAGSMFGIALRDIGDRIAVSNNDTLFYPVSAATATAINAPAGWHLITVQANQADPGFLGNTSTDNTAVGMIIEAGARRNGDGAGSVLTQARTWIRGATNNSLTSLLAGRAYFVYLNAADSTFTGN